MAGILNVLSVFSILVLCHGAYKTLDNTNQGGYYDMYDENGPGPDPMKPIMHVKLEPGQVAELVKDFSTTLNQQIENFTAFHFLENEYIKVVNEQSFHTVDGNSLVNEIASDINRMLKKKIKAVEELVKVAQTEYIKSHYEENLDLDYINNKKLLSNEDLQVMGISVANASKIYKYIHLEESPQFNNERINYNLSTIHVPTNVFDKAPVIQNGVNWSQALDKQFDLNVKTDQSLKWQYFCSSDGFFRIYPGIKWPKNNTDGRIDTFDCRMRSWYTKAATTPKNIIVLVDSSGSMKGLRMKITHSTVDKILQTLSDEDHFNIIQFSDEPSYIDPSCTNRTLIHASESNKRRLLDKVKQIEPKQKANFSLALSEAFELFKEIESQNDDTQPNTKNKLCNKAIMLITDGAPETYEKVFQKYNFPFNKTVRVFTYLIGREASDSRNARWIADANRGYYTHISTMADVQENVQKYIRVMSKPLALSKAKNHIWTSLYADYLTETSDDKDKGLQFVVSFATPVYDLKGNETEHRLLGVAGTDVTIKQIEDLIPYNRLGPNSYAFVVTHQGYVLFHPNFQPTYLKEEIDEDEPSLEYHPDYQNIDITEVEFTDDDEKLLALRRKLLEGRRKSFTMNVKVPYDGGKECRNGEKKRIMAHPYTFYFSKIPGNESDFSIGIALRQNIHATIAAKSQKLDLSENQNIRIAPWRYCKEEWKTFSDIRDIFAKKITGNLTKAKGCSMYSDNFLQWDLNDFTKLIFEEWKKRATEQVTQSSYDSSIKQMEVYQRFGVEQVFLWTFAGVTKFIAASPNLTEPNFIDENVETVKNRYFRQTVESVIQGINFTYSLPDSHNLGLRNNMVITMTRPVHINNFTTLVAGLQMKYSRFIEVLEGSIQSSVKKNALPKNNISMLTCKDMEHLNCYILDHNGYIMYSNADTENTSTVGNLTQDVSLMRELIKLGFLKNETYVNQQDMCKKSSKKEGSSSASLLLNPFKQLLSLVMWVFTETTLFLLEWSWFSGGHNSADSKIVLPGSKDCVLLNELEASYNLSTMPKREQHFLLTNYQFCKESEVFPCAKRHTRYVLNFDKLKEYSVRPYTGVTNDCQMCSDPMFGAACEADPTISMGCKRDYSIQWLKDTNLMFVSISSTHRCMCLENPMLKPMPPNLDKEKPYNERIVCDNLLEKTSRVRIRKECTDYHPKEPQKENRAETTKHSFLLLLVTSLFYFTTNQNSV